MEDPNTFRYHIRMTSAKFDELLALVEPFISKQDTLFREALPATLKLEIVLRFLASGDSFGSLEHSYRVPKSSISKFLIPVLQGINKCLHNYIKVPSTEAEWKEIANGFSTRWNFPNCCGSIDGKHIRLKNAAHGGSEFYNYKGFYSIVLLALVDSEYKFKYIDIGWNGRINDSTIFRDSKLKECIENGSINFPNWGVIVGDDAFPLSTYLMKPYSHRRHLTDEEIIFNYRLSRARRVVENAFRILSSRFRVFLSCIELCPEKVDLIVKAACALHNWLRETDYMPPFTTDHEDLESGTIIPGSWRNEILNSFERKISFGSNNYSKAAGCRKKFYTKYFVEEGAVPWQWRKINKT